MDGTPKRRRPPMPLPTETPPPVAATPLNFLERSEMEWGEPTEKRLIQTKEVQDIEGLLYKTFSLCPRCTLLEKKSGKFIGCKILLISPDLALKSAHVIEKEGKVWLSVQYVS